MSNVEENLNLSEPLVLDSAPTHHVYCENGVCKIDVSHNDDERFNLFLSKSRSLFEVFLSKCVNNMKNDKSLNDFLNKFNEDPSHLNLYVLCLKSYKSSAKQYLSNLSISVNSLKSYMSDIFDSFVDDENNEDTYSEESDQENTEQGMFDNNFMDTIKLFAESQKNFSDILNNQSKFLNKTESESDYESDESEEYNDDECVVEDNEDTDTENEESDTDNSLLSVVKYFAQSQSNFSKILYYFMNFE